MFVSMKRYYDKVEKLEEIIKQLEKSDGAKILECLECGSRMKPDTMVVYSEGRGVNTGIRRTPVPVEHPIAERIEINLQHWRNRFEFLSNQRR